MHQTVGSLEAATRPLPVAKPPAGWHFISTDDTSDTDVYQFDVEQDGIGSFFFWNRSASHSASLNWDQMVG